MTNHSKPELLFFYGTLMRGDRRGHFLEDEGLARPVGRGTLADAALYSVSDAFPAYLPGGSGEIVGEVWTPIGVTPEDRAANLARALVVTDSIEGYHADSPGNSMYLRVRVTLTDGRSVYTYRWNRGMGGLRPIPSGSWRTHQATLESERMGAWR